MPKVVVTFTKHRPIDPWISILGQGAYDYFTQEERDAIITPYLAFVRSLPGISPVGAMKVSPTGDTFSVERTYDTMENLIAGEAQLGRSSKVPIVVAKAKLIESRILANGIQPYDMNIQIIP